VAQTFTLHVNGTTHQVEAEPDMPLLCALRDKRSCSIRRACAASTGRPTRSSRYRMRPKPSTWLLINHPDQAPGGAGEAVCRPVAGAIANVLFDALACGCAAARVKSALG
jgi:hypothetical protein